MDQKKIKYILTDIEGTTTSVSFVYDILFPYFKAHIKEINNFSQLQEVKEAFSQVIEIVAEEENEQITTSEEVLKYLEKWSNEDRKVTPLKTLQGILWRNGYTSGELKGHVYDDVPSALEDWRKKGLKLGVFSSGSIAAQKLIFGNSIFGDLSKNFSHYFDTNTGQKRDVNTYIEIAKKINLLPAKILFLSDIYQELEAAKEAGFQTLQLVRPGTAISWNEYVHDFSEINSKIGL